MNKTCRPAAEIIAVLITSACSKGTEKRTHMCNLAKVFTSDIQNYIAEEEISDLKSDPNGYGYVSICV